MVMTALDLRFLETLYLGQKLVMPSMFRRVLVGVIYQKQDPILIACSRVLWQRRPIYVKLLDSTAELPESDELPAETYASFHESFQIRVVITALQSVGFRISPTPTSTKKPRDTSGAPGVFPLRVGGAILSASVKTCFG